MDRNFYVYSILIHEACHRSQGLSKLGLNRFVSFVSGSRQPKLDIDNEPVVFDLVCFGLKKAVVRIWRWCDSCAHEGGVWSLWTTAREARNSYQVDVVPSAILQR